MAKIESGRLREKIDSGALGDKVPVEDPAAAPLETDAETGGAPTPAAAAEREIREREPVAARFQGTFDATRRTRLIALAVAVLLLTLVLIALTLPG